jgi:hypothetical protein
MFLLSIPVIAGAVGLAVLYVPLGIAVGVLAIGLVVALGSALSGVYNAVLYRYATTGESSGSFHAEDLHATFRPKRR